MNSIPKVDGRAVYSSLWKIKCTQGSGMSCDIMRSQTD